MPKRSSKKDINEKAFSIVQMVTGESKPAQVEKSETNPAAVALGRLGGLKGGQARARKLCAEERTRIAQQAARARWSKEKNQSKS